MQIKKETVVSLSYILRNDNATGDIIEVAKETEPLVFIYGIGQMIPKFEENLEKLQSGDPFDFTLVSSDAYGEFDENAIIDLDKGIFSQDGKINEELLVIGNIIPMRDSQGHILQGKVIEILPESVRMDFNHPMAGKDLHFSGKILNVRDASADEISHGHVHGEGGHHH